MDKGINFACSELRGNIIKNINESGLPPVNIKYILMDLLQETVAIENRCIAEEKNKYEQTLKKTNETPEEIDKG